MKARSTTGKEVNCAAPAVDDDLRSCHAQHSVFCSSLVFLEPPMDCHDGVNILSVGLSSLFSPLCQYEY